MKKLFPSFLTKMSLRTQLILVILATSVISILVAGTALFVDESRHARAGLTEELTSLARLIGERSSAALVFMDSGTANENLHAFSNLDQIGSACLFAESGKLFAQYHNHDASATQCILIQPLGQTTALYADNAIRVQVPVISNGDLVGAAQINSTTSLLSRRLIEQGVALFAATVGAILVALVVALQLQKAVSGPIAQMRAVAHDIVESKDFALRAPNFGPYEVRELANAFNSMLGTIETQNIALEERESYARQLFYDSPIAQLITDPDTLEYIDCNQAAARIHGFASRDELIGKTTMEVVAVEPREQENMRKLLLQRYAAIGRGRVETNQMRYRRQNGQLWDGKVTYMMFTRNGRNLVQACVEDFTYRKEFEDGLRRMNDELEARVASRTTDLAEANRTLQSAHEALQRTQTELIQREKMASLGVLVAGVSHELNTPLGNSLTVGTHLRDELTRFEEDRVAGKITRTRMEAFEAQMHSGLDLLLRNLQRAIEQVAHFKQVSVDQASDQRRKFDLRTIVSDIQSILTPRFKHTPHRFTVDIGEGHLMDSYPGALGQVITNLVLNSLIHGFSDDMQGVVSVTAAQSDPEHLLLIVSDNGKGIPRQNLSRVFDPFFTTRMGQGGSGLGLHIVFNIVNSYLGGNIQVSSEEGIRTTFTILIPYTAPT